MNPMTPALPAIDQAAMPAAVRGGSAERREQYQAALGFERVMLGQLTEQLMSGIGDEDAPAAVKVMRQQLPGTLADALIGAGGIGLARQLDANWSDALHTSLGAASGTAGTDVAADAGKPGTESGGVIA